MTMLMEPLASRRIPLKWVMTFSRTASHYEDTIYPDNLDTLVYAVKSARRPYQTPSGPDVLDLTAPGGMIPLNHPFQVTATLDDTRYQE